MRKVLVLVCLAAAAFNSGCGEPAGPVEVAREFLSHLQHGHYDNAGDLVADDIRSNLEDRFGGKRIIGFVIEDIAISEDGDTASIRWSMDVEEGGSQELSENGRLELGRDEDDRWRIVAF